MTLLEKVRIEQMCVKRTNTILDDGTSEVKYIKHTYHIYRIYLNRLKLYKTL